MHRHNSFLIGKYEDIEVIGFKSQFTMMHGNNEDCYFLEVEKGIGINKESKFEGIRKNNFFGTYLIGPLLILNPLFTKKILNLMKIDKNVALEEETMAAYEYRLKELRKL